MNVAMFGHSTDCKQMIWIQINTGFECVNFFQFTVSQDLIKLKEYNSFTHFVKCCKFSSNFDKKFVHNFINYELYNIFKRKSFRKKDF